MQETLRVSIIRNVSSSPEPGIFVTTPTIVAQGYITLVTARANTVYNATIREQTVSHEGWARANNAWKAVNTGDTIRYRNHNLQVMRVNDEGRLDSAWLHFELDEHSLQEVS